MRIIISSLLAAINFSLRHFKITFIKFAKWVFGYGFSGVSYVSNNLLFAPSPSAGNRTLQTDTKIFAINFRISLLGLFLKISFITLGSLNTSRTHLESSGDSSILFLSIAAISYAAFFYFSRMLLVRKNSTMNLLNSSSH